MKCLLCNVEDDNDEVLKDHYINFHSNVKDNYFFKELFRPDFDKYSKRCIECGGLSFETSRKRTIVFCCIKKHSGGSLALPLNIQEEATQKQFTQ